MYAVIYDQFDPERRNKLVLSVHRKRVTAEKALKKRQKEFDRRVWECNSRVVWVDGQVRQGDYITPDVFSTWAPGEKDPYEELYSDTD